MIINRVIILAGDSGRTASPSIQKFLFHQSLHLVNFNCITETKT